MGTARDSKDQKDGDIKRGWDRFGTGRMRIWIMGTGRDGDAENSDRQEKDNQDWDKDDKEQQDGDRMGQEQRGMGTG